MAIDGNPHCSYDLDFEEVDRLEPPEDTVRSTLEYVESQVFAEDGYEDLLDSVPTEEIRAVDVPPPQVGTLYYEDGRVEDVEVDLPENFFEW